MLIITNPDFGRGIKTKAMKTMKTVFLSQEEFERDLDICLLIVHYPSKRRNYYVCEYTSPSLEQSMVEVYINK